jgi:phospholipid/cholesterol/gamma-HCH transport system substrate-binding protein
VSLSTQLRRYARPLAALLAMMVVAVGVAFYVLAHQRLRFPWESVYHVNAEFTSAQAVTPGQGQNVTVAGVTVGQISSVHLHDGRAVVGMEIDPGKLPAVYDNAHMLLRPKTGLNDMSIEMDPGDPPGRRLRDGGTLSAAHTEPNVNPDEVLAALDGDTRSYLTILLNDGGRALAGRGVDLRRVLRASEPALAQTKRITAALSDRRAKLARLVHNLGLLSRTTATRTSQLARLVETADATFGALASQEGSLRDSVSLLPGTLQEAHGALDSTRGFAAQLGPALTALRPAARDLAPALLKARPLLRDGRPILANQIRPLVHDAVPVARDLPPTLSDLRGVTPDLISAFRVLNYVVNELAYNPPGPAKGYLFWTAWFFHNSNSVVSLEDAHGATWRGQLLASCSTFDAIPQIAPLLQLVAAAPTCPPH